MPRMILFKMRRANPSVVTQFPKRITKSDWSLVGQLRYSPYNRMVDGFRMLPVSPAVLWLRLNLLDLLIFDAND